MKKSLTFLMLMLCCIGVVFAKPVDSELAKKVALNFLKSTEKVAAAASAAMIYVIFFISVSD